MNPRNQDEIAKRAYAIWEREGQPDGRDAAHWQMAEQELDREDKARGDGVAGSGAPSSERVPSSERAPPRKPTLVRSRPRKSGT